jgi:hypothetical protein
MEGIPPPERTYRHLAFKATQTGYPCSSKSFAHWAPRVPGKGTSLYFYDFDNHLYALHSGTLEERLARYIIDT